MADDKLQELIETLKKQGVETGEATSRSIIEKAQKEADEIVAKAKAEAEDITKQAKAEADKSLTQLQSSMEIAASQFVTKLKKVIEKELLAFPLEKSLTKTLDETEIYRSALDGQRKMFIICIIGLGLDRFDDEILQLILLFFGQYKQYILLFRIFCIF